MYNTYNYFILQLLTFKWLTDYIVDYKLSRIHLRNHFQYKTHIFIKILFEYIPLFITINLFKEELFCFI